MKPVIIGLGYLVDEKGKKILARNKDHAERIGYKHNPIAVNHGFRVSVFEAADYYRISYGRKA